jgi:hypothetical protein
VKAHHVLGEAVRARTMIPHFLLHELFTLLVVLASSFDGDDLFQESFRCADHRPIMIGGRIRAASNRFARDGKVPGPQLGGETITRRTAP